MNDFYTEHMVKKKTTGSTIAIKILMVLLTIASVVVTLLFPFGIILPLIMIAIDVFVFRGQDLEFEYLYVNGDLDIDKIMGKAKRKRVFSSSIEDLELLAPSSSDAAKRIQVNKTLNFSSFDSEHKTYDLVVKQNGQKIRVIFEPNDIILNGYKMLAPRKVEI